MTIKILLFFRQFTISHKDIGLCSNVTLFNFKHLNLFSSTKVIICIIFDIYDNGVRDLSWSLLVFQNVYFIVLVSC